MEEGSLPGPYGLYFTDGCFLPHFSCMYILDYLFSSYLSSKSAMWEHRSYLPKIPNTELAPELRIFSLNGLIDTESRLVVPDGRGVGGLSGKGGGIKKYKLAVTK